LLGTPKASQDAVATNAINAAAIFMMDVQRIYQKVDKIIKKVMI